MKKKLFFISIILIQIFANCLYSQQISYILPDIAAPGSNSYIEIIAPHDANGNFGIDTIYSDNSDDPVHIVFDNPSDSSKIVFGPLIVSWQGRMISTQVFVNPNIQPNTDFWNNLSLQFKIPFRVNVNGNLSNSDTIFIVKPYSLGNVSALLDRILGEGGLGRRSKRGAMIVDSLILAANTNYTISITDCDPYTPGNQAYLPFILISQGKIYSNGTNTKIIADGGYVMIQNAAPGGGGGGGRFCDRLFTGSTGEDGGAGFTGGGKGGYNNIISGGGGYQNLGVGTAVVGGLNGYSLNGVQPPAQNNGSYEASGGGTGHPFGLSGIGTADGNSDSPNGGYGGGSGYRQNQAGGSGGYTTNGTATNASTNNGGKIYGNIMAVPIAGGSGGASGNPQASTGGCSGSGGGGGGAMMISALNLSNLNFSVKGANGGSSSYGQGGSGSGGFIGLIAKINIDNIQNDVSGGSNGSQTGGAGRIRMDYSLNSSINNLPPSASIYRGLSTDTSKYVKRNFTIGINGTPNSEIKFYVKPQSGNWSVLNSVILPTSNFSVNIILPGNDPIYYLTAVQTINSPSSLPYNTEPPYITSQASANLLIIDKFPHLKGDSTANFRLWQCPGAFQLDTIKITNIDDGNLILKLQSAYFKYNNGFSVVSPTVQTILAKNDTIPVIIQFSYQAGQIGTIVDTLFIPNNDDENGNNPFKIYCKAVIDTFKLRKYDTHTGNNITEIDLGEICVGSFIDTSFNIMNYSSNRINIGYIGFDDPLNFPVLSMVKTSFDVKEEGTVSFRFSPLSTGYFKAKLYLKFKECNSFIDSVIITGKGVKMQFSVDVQPTNPQIRVGLKDTIEVHIKNIGNTITYILTQPVLKPPFTIIRSNPTIPCILDSNSEIIIYVEFAPTDTLEYYDTLNISVLGGSCMDTVSVVINGKGLSPLIVVLFLPELKLSPKLTHFSFPVYAIAGNNLTAKGLKLQATIKFNGTLLYFYHQQTYPVQIVSDSLGYNSISNTYQRFIKFEMDSVNITDSKQIIGNFDAATLLGDSDSTALEWLDYKWLDSNRTVGQTQLVPGYLTISICRAGGDRLIQYSPPLKMSIKPNPAGDDFSMDITTLEKGKHIVYITNLQGERKTLFEWDGDAGVNYQYRFDCSELSTGCYFISLQSPSNCLFEKLFIIK